METVARPKYVQTGPTIRDTVHAGDDPYRTDIRDEPLTTGMSFRDMNLRLERLYQLRDRLADLAAELDDEGLMASWFEMDKIAKYVDEATDLLIFAMSGLGPSFSEMNLTIPPALPSRHKFHRTKRMASIVIGSQERTGGE